ncbi:MAG: PqqD family protein [Bacteroidetes bacterium]|nr:PqqD family protein [Bacteroidota bacterium]
MNFFKRRKILKDANFLVLHPVRTLNYETRDDGNINLLMPRFKSPVSSRMFQPPAKEKYIPIKLDKFGSATWLLIDGVKNVAAICALLKENYSAEFENTDETEDRVTKFLSLLYQQRYITFIEIQNKSGQQAE